MAENSKISWCDTTWNPLAGCTRASAGCDHCYAAVMSLRLEAMAKADIAIGKNLGRKEKYLGVATKNKVGVPVFNGKINLDYETLDEPKRWKRPRKVFVNSMSDLFHKDVPFSFVARVFAVMQITAQHTYQVLTKRPKRMLFFQREYYPNGFPANVWVGTSVEDQETADLRIPHLLKVEAVVRFLSMEPLLGKVLLDDGQNSWLTCDGRNRKANEGECCESYAMMGECFHGIDWVIVGGESGPNARPMHPDWARSIRDQCVAGGVPFHFKQWGEWLPSAWSSEPTGQRELCLNSKGDFVYAQVGHAVGLRMPDDVLVRKVGKHNAGRLLDGREWNQFPNMEETA